MVLYIFCSLCRFFALKHFGKEIFIRLDTPKVSYNIFGYVNNRFCQQTSLCTLLSAKTNTLLIQTWAARLRGLWDCSPPEIFAVL